MHVENTPKDSQIRWPNVHLSSLCVQIPAWSLPLDGSSKIECGKYGPYFIHFTGVGNVLAQPASSSVWRQGCAHPITTTSIPGGMSQFVIPDRDQGKERVIWGNPRNYPMSGKPKKRPRQDLSILFSLLHLFSGQELDSGQETTEGFSYPPLPIYTTEELSKQ